MIDGKPLTGTEITVVGGGIGGLSAAAVLADGGADVTVLERREELGGVVGRLEIDGFTFDTGPTWYLMPEVFERFFGAFDRSPTDYYGLKRLDPQYRVFFGDGDAVTVTPDLEQVKSVFESYETGAGEALDRYLHRAKRTYEIGMERFVYADRSRFRDLIDPAIVGALPALRHLDPMDEYVARFFEEEKLRQLLEYTLVFLGSSPRKTPALYNLMSHVDLNLGVHYPDGGLYSVVEALKSLGRDLGVTYRTGSPVTGLDPVDGGIRVETRTGSRDADAVVANANPAHVESDLLPPGRGRPSENWSEMTYGPSALLLYLGVEGAVDPLAHHTLVFPKDWSRHFDSIFEDPSWPVDPAYYVSVASRTDEDAAPDGHHAIVILVPLAPGLEDTKRSREVLRERVLADLAETVGLDLRGDIRVERRRCIRDFEREFRTPGGTALGLAHTLDQTGPLRPAHRGPIANLYYAGAFTNPGVGLPMTIISGEHAADAIAEDHTEGMARRLLTQL